MLFFAHSTLLKLKRLISAQSLQSQPGIVKDQNVPRYPSCEPHSMGTIIWNCLGSGLAQSGETACSELGSFLNTRHLPGTPAPITDSQSQQCRALIIHIYYIVSPSPPLLPVQCSLCTMKHNVSIFTLADGCR